jgi:hypothetical protein
MIDSFKWWLHQYWWVGVFALTMVIAITCLQEPQIKTMLQYLRFVTMVLLFLVAISYRYDRGRFNKTRLGLCLIGGGIFTMAVAHDIYHMFSD